MNLAQNYPNPFNPSTTFTYQISKNEFVTLIIYDVLGNEIATLINEEKTTGIYKYNFQIESYDLPSGVYFYQLRAGSFIQTKKMIVLK